MEKPWMNNILHLQEIVNDNITSENSPEAQNHLQCLIDCIQELYGDQRRLKDELEKTSIKAHALRYSFGAKKQDNVIEKKNFIEQTRQQKQKTIQNIIKETEAQEEEIKTAEEKMVLFDIENKKLETAAKTARKQATTLSVLANDLMQQKHEVVVQIKENRRDTFDAHESAYGYIDVIKDVRLDVKQYSQYFEKQIYAFEKRTKIWNVKAEKERKKFDSAREEFRSVEVDLKAVKRTSQSIELSFSKHTEKLEDYSIRIKKFLKNSNAKKDEYEVLDLKVRDLEKEFITLKADLLEKAKNKAQVVEIIRDDMYDEQEMHELLTEEYANIEKKLETTTDTLNCARAKADEAKEIARILTEQVEEAMDAIVGRRSQRMGFKESLIVVADRRETMENVFAVEFDEEYAVLRSETVLKMKAAREATLMLEEHENHLKEFDNFRRTCINAAAYNRNVFATLQGDGSDLMDNLTERRSVIARLRGELEVARAELDDIKLYSLQILKRLTDNKEYLEVQVQYLKENVLKNLLSKVSRLTEEYNQEEIVFSKKVSEYSKQYRFFNGINQEIKNANKNLEEKTEATCDLKKLLRKARLDGLRQLMRHICETAMINREIYVRMWKCAFLDEINQEILDRVRFTLREKHADRQEWSSCASFINGSTARLRDSKDLFRKLIRKGNVMTESALNWGGADLQKLRSNLRFESKKTKVMRDTYDNLMPVLIDLGKVSSDISDYKHAVGEGESRREMLRQSKRKLLKRHMTF